VRPTGSGERAGHPEHEPGVIPAGGAGRRNGQGHDASTGGLIGAFKSFAKI